MTTAFSWMNNAMVAIAKLLPRIHLVRATYSAAVYLRDGTVRVWGPGIHWYWPMTTEVRMVPRTVRSHCEDGITVGHDEVTTFRVPVSVRVGAVLHWKVGDVARFVHIHDVRAWICGTIHGCAVDAWRESADIGAFHTRIQLLLAGRLREQGIILVRCTVGSLYKQMDVGTVQQYSLETSGKHDTEE